MGWARVRILSIFASLNMEKQEKTYLEYLKQLICEATDRQMNCASDFVFLQAFVFERTHEHLGLNTLKRIWNYGNTPTVPRLYTLDVLSKVVGYGSFEGLKEYYGQECTDASDKVLGKVVRSMELQPGDRVSIAWQPGRTMLAEFLGNNTYRILKSERTKLQPGTTFQTSFFAVGHPLLLSNLICMGVVKRTPLLYLSITLAKKRV